MSPVLLYATLYAKSTPVMATVTTKLVSAEVTDHSTDLSAQKGKNKNKNKNK